MADTLLVIGIHREELAYGDQVARGVTGADIDLLRIDCGLSNQRPRYHEQFYYITAHRELYLQVRQQVKARHRLVIDLHAGLSDTGRWADIYAQDQAFLARFAKRLLEGPEVCRRLKEVARLVRIVEKDGRLPAKWSLAESTPTYPVCRTVIPEAVWHSRRFLYVGLEVYMRTPATGDEEDLKLGYELVGCIRDSRMSRAEAENAGGERPE